MSAPQVLSIIASLNGGFNGDVPGKQIGVEILSDTEAIYTLTQWADGADGNWNPTDQIEHYRLTLVEFTAEAPPVEEAAQAPEDEESA